MLGNTNDIRKKTEDNRSDEACYGGFGGRFSYEKWCRDDKKSRFGRLIPKLTLIVGISLFFGLLGALCAITVFQLVDENRELYYPNTSGVEELSTSVPARELAAEAQYSGSEAFFMKNSVLAENVSHETSQRYRIPTGIMIHKVSENSSAYNAGLLGGDIIVAVDGSTATDIASLDSLLSSYDFGTVVKFTVFRGDSYLDLAVNIE